MKLFIELEDNEVKQVQARLDELLGKLASNNSEQSYLSAFNHDCKLINSLLTQPKQETLFRRKAYESQEDYNQALAAAKKRWEASEKEFDNGAIIIKDLTARKKVFDASMVNLQSYEQKFQLLKSYCVEQDVKSNQNSPWMRLQAVAASLDKPLFKVNVKFEKYQDSKTYVERLREVQTAWQAQGELANGNTKDILKLTNELDNFEGFLDFIASKISPQSKHTIDKKIITTIRANRERLKDLRQKSIAALGWRIRSAINAGNLRCDDCLLGLINELKFKVFKGAEQAELDDVTDLLSLSNEVKTFEMTFEQFNEALKKVQSAQDKTWYNHWLASRWVKNADKQNLIEVVNNDGVAIPAKLAALTPAKPSFTPDSWVRYWFFRMSESTSLLWVWLRKKFIGDYSESITFINETYRQVVNFETILENNRQEGYLLNLNYLGSAPSFMAALSLPQIFSDELKRGKFARPTWFAGELLRKIPFFNRAASFQFFSIWREELNVAQKTLGLKYQNIAKIIVEDFESLLFNSITSKSFTFPKNLINDLVKFIQIYAHPEDLAKFNDISDPITILQKFDFLLDKKGDNVVRTLNEDAIISFVGFAEKYWPNDKVEAIKAIVNVINRSGVPANGNEDTLLMKKIECLLEGKDKQKVFNEMMKMIALKYLFEIGDDGNNNVYAFLKRFAPEAANNWKTQRQLDLEEKFILLNKILSDGQKKEMDLTANAIHQAGSLQLRYNNFALYIADIKEADELGGTKKEALLVTQAEKYIRSYQGNNNDYAQLLLKLCIPSHVATLNSYAKKRFSYIFNSQNQILLSISLQDYQFFAQVAKHPNIMQTLFEVVDAQCQGENLDLAEIVLSFNQPKVTAKYFAKHFEKRLNDDFASLARDKALFADQLTNEAFVENIVTALSNMMQKLVSNNEWAKLESKDFAALIENYGSQRLKESYRLLRIKHLIEKSNSDDTKAYLMEISGILNGKLETDLITLPDTKLSFDAMLEAQTKKLLKEEKWEGHTQYFLEYFLSGKNKYLLHDMRAQWFCDYLYHPEKYADENALEKSYMEAKFHYQNLETPNDQSSLETFYGRANAQRIKELVMSVLDSVDTILTDEQISLLRRYFKDKWFSLDNKGPLFTKKFEIYQRMLKIVQMASESQFNDAVKFSEGFVDEIKGLEEINATEPTAEREFIINYNKKMLQILTGALEKSYKELLISKDALEFVDSPSFSQRMSRLRHARKSLNTLIVNSNLPQTLKSAINELESKAQTIIDQASNFVKTLNFNTLHLIEISEEKALLFKECLSEEAKKYLFKRIAVVRGFLSKDDPFYEPFLGFLHLIRKKYNTQETRKNDVQLVEKYRTKQRNYPELANKVAANLIDILTAHTELSQCAIFNELKGSYQSAFLNEISLPSKRLLIKSVQAKIEWMMTSAEVSVVTQREDWLNNSKLYEWLSKGTNDDEMNLKKVVSQWAMGCLADAKKALLSLIDKYDNVLLDKNGTYKNILQASSYTPKADILQDEKQLLKFALFIRAFGDELQKKSLDKLLGEVAKRQRKVMMNALSGPFVEHCLDYADKLLSVAGSQEQRQESIQLIDTWNRFRAVSLVDIRNVAVSNAIPQYIADFDNEIFQYFISKHNLKEDFTPLMISKIEQWDLADELVEPTRLLKKYPIDVFQKILVEQASVQKHGLFYSAPTVNDAQKLFVAFCLMLEAHQLATIWKKRHAQNDLRNFNPEDISEPLSNMVKMLSKQFDIGRNRFNQSISKAIHKDSENFASWSTLEIKDKEVSPQLKVQLARK